MAVAAYSIKSLHKAECNLNELVLNKNILHVPFMLSKLSTYGEVYNRKLIAK